MKKLITILFIFIGVYTKAQLPISTIGGVFNFEVGDTFEYQSQLMCGAGSPPQTIYYDRYIVEEKVQVTGAIKYIVKHSRCSEGYTSVGGGQFLHYSECPLTLDTVQWIYNQLNDAILDSAVSWINGSNYHIDTAFYDAGYAVKVNSHSFMASLSNSETIVYGDGLGLLERHTAESGNGSFCENLIYFHKANGQQWGAPYVLPVGVSDLQKDFAITVFPNPAEDHFEINTEYQATFTLYNALGQQVLSQKVDKVSTISRNDIPAGIYYWLAEQEGQKLATGKLIFR